MYKIMKNSHDKILNIMMSSLHNRYFYWNLKENFWDYDGPECDEFNVKISCICRINNKHLSKILKNNLNK